MIIRSPEELYGSCRHGVARASCLVQQGFERPGTSWTTGDEVDLRKVVQEHLK